MCAHRLTTQDADTNNLLPLSGLQPADVVVTRSILRSLAPTWTLDEHHDAVDGSLMLMLTPPGVEDTTPTFILSQTPDGIQAAAALGDSCDTLLTAPSIRHAVWMALKAVDQITGLHGGVAGTSSRT